MGNIITPVLPHDLPENWNDTQYVSPGGTEVGLTEKHGYNYLMKQVNNSQKAINELDAELEEIYKTLANKAPAGYGLGTTPKKITDWNDAKIDGWYYSSEGAANAPDSTVGCFGLVYNQGGPEVCVQEVWGLLNINKYYHWRRLVYPGSGTPWEWVDPPMYEGVVYRTTERHLGNPVYKKMDSNGVIWWSTDRTNWKVEAERTGCLQSNQNLLDNPWFTVNQRGKQKYTGAGYSFDRWYLWGGSTLTKNSNGSITLSAGDWRNLIQIFELDLFNKLVGKTVTASVLLDDGTVSSRTFVFTDPGNGYNQINLYPNPFSGKVFCLNMYGPSNSNIANRPYFNLYTNVDVTVKAMKLELGSVSTLANDVPPNYAQELAKCQRYFQVIPRFGAIGVNAWGSSVELYYWMPTTMRTIPSATFPSDLSNAIHEMGSRSLTPDSMILDGSSFLSTEKIAIVVRGSNMSTGKVYGNNTIIPLTADL